MTKFCRHYVYLLTDPRDMSVFYVGKGTGTRKNQHTHRITLTDTERSQKAERIRAILGAGEEVVSTIVKRFEDEAEALEHERYLIARYGMLNLTNANGGGGGDISKRTSARGHVVKTTPKQQRFIDEYPIDNNASAACVRAGYSKKGANVTGSQLLAKPHIAAAIAMKQKELARSCNVTIENLSEMYHQVFDMALNTTQPGAAATAVTGLAKLHGLSIDRQKHEGGVVVQVVTGVPRDGDGE